MLSRTFPFFVLLFLISFSRLTAQVRPISVPDGEAIVAVLPIEDLVQHKRAEVIATAHALYMVDRLSSGGVPVANHKIWSAPKGAIQSIANKVKKANMLFVLTTEGRLFVLSFFLKNGAVALTKADDYGIIPVNVTDFKTTIGGDEIYAIGQSGAIYVTPDHINWTIDTTGLNGATVNSMAFDTALNAYVATSRGVYVQTKSARTWQTTGMHDYSRSLFYLTTDSLYVSTYDGLYLTTDRGQEWVRDVNGLDTFPVTAMAKDSRGTLYLSNDDGVSRKDRSSSAWTKLGANAPSLYNAVGSLAADSFVYVGNSSGFHYSTNQGLDWGMSNKGVLAERINDLIVFRNDTRMMRTGIGVFSKRYQDTAWHQGWPEGINALYVDTAEHVYATGNYHWGYGTTGAQDIFITSDEGLTWLPDTAGLNQFPSGDVYVDAIGTEHIGYTRPDGFSLFRKRQGGSWESDAAGFESSTNQWDQRFLSDGRGLLYLMTSSGDGLKLYRRSIEGDQWELVGTQPKLSRKFVADRNGDLIIVMDSALLQFRNLSWSTIPIPTRRPKSTITDISIDSSNAIYLSFAAQAVTGGTYRSNDLGVHWQTIDTIVRFKKLVSFADSTFGLSDSGAYVIGHTSSTAGSVVESAHSAFEISVSPNPARGVIGIRASKDLGKVRISVTNEAGVLVRSYEAALGPAKELAIDLRNEAAGVYLVTVDSAAGAIVRRVVVL